MSALPQIICLHGRGSNARIMKFQARMIIKRLEGIFEFLFLDAPFECEAGPGILPWFEGMGPYFHWGSTTIGSTCPKDQEIREMAAVNAVLDKALTGNPSHSAAAGHKNIIGVMGFSQGTRVTAGLLKRQEVMLETESSSAYLEQRSRFLFGIFVCGGGGLSFSPFDLVPPSFSMPTSSQIKDTDYTNADEAKVDLAGGVDRLRRCKERKIRMETVHVHGKIDEIAPKGRDMVEAWFEPGSAKVLSVDAGHHFPRGVDDVERICGAVLEIFEKYKDSSRDPLDYN